MKNPKRNNVRLALRIINPWDMKLERVYVCEKEDDAAEIGGWISSKYGKIVHYEYVGCDDDNEKEIIF